MLRRLVGGRWINWHLVAIALTGAGIVHIVSTFAIPVVGVDAGSRRFLSDMPANTMRVLPPVAPGREALAYNDPGERLAVCRLDLSAGPVTVKAHLPSRGWTLAIHTRAGDNIYALSASGLRQPDVILTIEPPRERLFGIFTLPQTPYFDPSRVSATENEGIVLIRAPSRGEAFAEAVQRALERATCEAETQGG